MRSNQLLFDSFYPSFIFRGEGKGLSYMLVKDRLHFGGPPLAVFLVFKPLFNRLGNMILQFPVFHSRENSFKINVGGPNGIRTRVLALRGPRPRPLDDGTYKDSE